MSSFSNYLGGISIIPGLVTVRQRTRGILAVPRALDTRSQDCKCVSRRGTAWGKLSSRIYLNFNNPLNFRKQQIKQNAEAKKVMATRQIKRSSVSDTMVCQIVAALQVMIENLMDLLGI